MNENEDGSK